MSRGGIRYSPEGNRMNSRTAAPVGTTTRSIAAKKRKRSQPIVAPLAISPARLALLPARSGDHAAIHRLLMAVFHGPSPAEFQAQIDEPSYDPANRLVVKHGERVAAHVRTVRRELRFGPVTIPTANWMDLATQPEYRSRGFGTALLVAAERRMQQAGVLLGLTRTRVPSLFARQGWGVCGRHVYSVAGARQVLAQLQATAEGVVSPACGDDEPLLAFRPAKPAVVVRPLRRIELPAIRELYAQSRPATALQGSFGAAVRSAETWDWLLARGACDRIYVASESCDSAELAQLLAGIRGYACVKDARLVELVTQPDAGPQIAEQLVARVCGDAIEQDAWHIRLDAPPGDPLHKLLEAAGGQIYQTEQSGGEVFMAKMLDSAGLLSRLIEPLAERLKASELTNGTTVELGLLLQSGSQAGRSHATEVERLSLVFTSRGAKVARGQLAKHYLTLRSRDLAALLLGHWSPEELVESGRAKASTKAARQLAAVLFPKLPWWRPPLDDLLA
jgi:GNAT superfamily N-acetyltransferase